MWLKTIKDIDCASPPSPKQFECIQSCIVCLGEKKSAAGLFFYMPTVSHFATFNKRRIIGKKNNGKYIWRENVELLHTCHLKWLFQYHCHQWYIQKRRQEIVLPCLGIHFWAVVPFIKISGFRLTKYICVGELLLFFHPNPITSQK